MKQKKTDNSNQLTQIVSMQVSDIEEIAEFLSQNSLFQEYGFTFVKALTSLKSALENSQNDLILYGSKGNRAGFAWFVKKGGFGRSGYLRLIAVEPGQQGSGIGQKFMSYFEEKYLAPNGIFLFVTSTNHSARKFYERLGYINLCEMPDYVKKGFTEILYYKKD